ncbi:MAG: competence/damage-inducible protein A, partial [Mariprofundus sp.]|nr:competence/damage-inducible protein A [Mariprofundus sp.]
PYIFASQLTSILDDFGDTPFQRVEIEVTLPESVFAKELATIQSEFDDVEVGSYPGRCGPDPCGKICLSSQNPDRLNMAKETVEAMLISLQ